MENQVLVSRIKQWLEIDKAISDQGKVLRELRKQKKELSGHLMEVMKTNEIDCFDCNSGQLMYTKNQTKKPINKKYLTTILSQYFGNDCEQEEKASSLCEFILENRTIEIRENLKLKKKK